MIFRVVNKIRRGRREFTRERASRQFNKIISKCIILCAVTTILQSSYPRGITFPPSFISLVSLSSFADSYSRQTERENFTEPVRASLSLSVHDNCCERRNALNRRASRTRFCFAAKTRFRREQPPADAYVGISRTNRRVGFKFREGNFIPFGSASLKIRTARHVGY